jgi:hypothetical protein
MHDWPAAIKFVPNWPTVTSRLGDVGYLDNSGIWRSVLNILDEDRCHAHSIDPLQLSRPKSEYITKIKFNNSSQDPIIRVSSGWGCSFLSAAELDRFLKAYRFNM